MSGIVPRYLPLIVEEPPEAFRLLVEAELAEAAARVARVLHPRRYETAARTAALERARSSPRRHGPYRFWTDEMILDAIRRHAARYGRPPFCSEWLAATDEHPSTSSVIKRLGWADAVEQAGFPRPTPGRGGPAGRLTPAQVSEIRESPAHRDAVAKRFGISPSHVANIKAGRRYPVEDVAA